MIVCGNIYFRKYFCTLASVRILLFAFPPIKVVNKRPRKHNKIKNERGSFEIYSKIMAFGKPYELRESKSDEILRETYDFLTTYVIPTITYLISGEVNMKYSILLKNYQIYSD